MLLCYLRISRQRQQVAMLNATLEYNTSLVRIQHVKRESDSTKKFTKKNVAVQISGGESYSMKECLPTLHEKCFCF